MVFLAKSDFFNEFDSKTLRPLFNSVSALDFPTFCLIMKLIELLNLLLFESYTFIKLFILSVYFNDQWPIL